MSPSLEDYLEEIYRVASSNAPVRVSDVAAGLRVKLPSVVKALHRLAAEQYLEYEGGDIILTSSGREVGRYLVERNRVIREFLQILGSHETAAREAEAVEHGFSLVTLKAIEALVAYMKANPALCDGFARFRESESASGCAGRIDFQESHVSAHGLAQRGSKTG